MSVTVFDDTGEEEYEILDAGQRVGYLAYERDEKQITLIHTEVDEAHAGHGYAATLMRFALDDARARGLSVLPYCPYARKFIAQHRDEYADLVPVNVRAGFGLVD